MPLIITNIIVYNQRVRSIKQEAFEKLTAIRDLKANQIDLWIKEKQKNVSVFSQSHSLRSLELSGREEGQKGPDPIQAARDILNTFQNIYRDFDEIFIIDSRTGRISASSSRANEGHDKSHDPYFTVPMEKGLIFIRNIYYSQALHKPCMTISLPIFSLEDDHQIISILVGRIDLKNSLETLMLDRTGMGETGETLLVNKETMALTELRHHANAPLNLKIQAAPALQSSQGKTGIMETKDYRGKEVLAAYTQITALEWGFVAKQDLSEVYAPIDQLLKNLSIIFVLAALIVTGLAFFLAKTLAAPIREMMTMTQTIAQGDLKARVITQARDEIGQLARSVNHMAETIASQMFVRQGAADAVQAMVGAVSLESFSKAVLEKFMTLSQTPLGVFYARDLKTRTFYPKESVGANAALLQPFDGDRLEGELGIALATRKISLIQELPLDTLFQFKTFVGSILPREIITIPIFANGEASAVICLASIHGCPPNLIPLLELIWPSLNTAYANFLAAEKTAHLAEELGEKNQELEAQTEELHSLAEELQQQSEELQIQNQELELQKQQVESASLLKSQFLSNMSHELRTPLNAVLALSRVLILQTREALSQEQHGYLEIIERNGKNLLDLINDILDLAKIESGRVDLHPADLNLGLVVENILENLDPLAQQKGLTLAGDIPQDIPQLYTDESRVYQILQNLVANALKFTEKGKVTLSVRCDGAFARIQVKDTGIGIAKDNLDHIFDEFRQVDGTSSRRYEGTGLGLTIARKATLLLGGNLSVKSTLGKGSCFTLMLPLHFSHGKITPLEPVNTPRPVERPLPAHSPSRPLHQHKLLVVEDNEAAVIQIKTAIDPDLFQVMVARDGQEAMALIASNRPDAIVLDLMVPKLDGFEILKNLAQDPKTARIPVLILTARDLSAKEKNELQAHHITLFKKGDVDLAQLGNKILEMTGLDQPSPSIPLSGPVRDDFPVKTKREEPLVLVIEDILDNRIALRAILQNHYTLMEAANGKEGLDMAQSLQPDLVLLDIHLPDMDGMFVVKSLKKNPGTARIPVLAVTASAMKGDREAMLEAGCDDYLAKPIDPEQLKTKIIHWLKLP